MNIKNLRFLPLLLTVIFFSDISSTAQQSNLSCSNALVRLINSSNPSFSVSEMPGATHSGIGYASWVNTSAVVDNTTTNYATGTIASTGGGTLTMSVSDAVYDYSPGNFAGFVISSGGIINLSLLNNITIRTYLNGTLKESAAAGSIVSVSVPLISGAYELGFYTNDSFDRVEIEFSASSAALVSYDVYYAVLRGTGSCPNPTLACNTNTRSLFPAYGTVINPARTSVSGISLSSFTNLDNIVDSDTSTYATLITTASVASTASVAVKNVVGDYPANTFAGFELQNLVLLDVALLNRITLTTYRNGVQKQQKTGTGLVLGASVLGNSSRQIVGFASDSVFDEIQIEITQPLTVSLGTTRIYSAVVKAFCPGPALVCNTPTIQNENTHPVFINPVNTGLTGAACAACSISATGNILDADTSNAAVIAMLGSAVSSGQISVKNQLTDYPPKTFAGFDIENVTLLNASVLTNVSISVYRDGVFKQTFSGTDILASVPSSLTGAGARAVLGYVADSSFDEVVLSLNQNGASLGTTRIFSAVIETFCPTTLACRTLTYLNAPAQPVIVEQRRTGTGGIACALCSVNNPGNAISASNSDYAQIVTTASVLTSTSLSVLNPVSTYPAKSIAGFSIQNVGTLIQLDLFKRLAISTYLDGVLQESRSAGQILNLSVLIPLISGGTGTSAYNAGFVTTKPFDEIQISVTPLLGIAPVVNVYSAYVDTRFVDTISATNICYMAPIAEADNSGTPKDSMLTSSLRVNDRDPQNLPLTYNTAPAVAPLHGTLVINANGTFTYQPASGYTGLDSFVYTVCNNQGLCSSASSYITVLPPKAVVDTNHGPLPQPDFSHTYLNIPVGGNARSNDIEPDGNPTTYTLSGAPKHGTMTVNANGTYLYHPDTNHIGTDTARIQVCDNGTPALCATSAVYLTIDPFIQILPNAAPFAQNDLVMAPPRVTTTGNVLDNDSDPDGDPLTASLIGNIPASAGTLTMNTNGTYSFVPATGFTGSVMIPYRACDAGRCDTAMLTIVAPREIPSRAPTAEADHTGTPKDSLLTSSLKVNDRDPQNLPLTYNTAPATAPLHGTLVINANGTFTYQPASGYTGADSFVYTVCNTLGLCSSATAYISVVPPKSTGDTNRAPMPRPDFSRTRLNTTVGGNASSNDIEPDGNPTSYTLVSSPKHGTITVSANGSYQYQPNTNYVGMDTAIIQVCDNGSPAKCATAPVYLTIDPIFDIVPNTPPFAQNDLVIALPRDTARGNVLNNDSDPDGNTLTAALIGTIPASSGTLTFNANGSFTFVPAVGFTGTVMVPYQACDASSCDTAMLTIVAPRDIFMRIYLRVYLEGALRNNGFVTAPDNRPLMRDNLRSSIFESGKNYIPGNNPYEFRFRAVNVVNRYTKLAPQNVQFPQFRRVTDSAAVFSVSGQDAIVDWVFVELRNKANNAQVLATRSALLQRDGDIVDVDGISGLAFPGVAVDSYFVAVRHRSHLATMTKYGQSPQNLQLLVDLTVTTTPLYDKGVVGANDFTGLSQKRNVRGTYRAMWQGDFNADGKVKYTNPNDDLSNMLSDVVNNSANSDLATNFDFAYGYAQGDFDMNGKTKYDNPNDDNNLLLSQVINYPLNVDLVTNFDFLIQQLP